MNYLRPDFSIEDVSKMSTLALAYTGDAVYELCTRNYVFSVGNLHSLDMHKMTISIVNAKSQSRGAHKLLNNNVLNENEIAFFKRGRNAKVNSVPKGATDNEYHYATGLETLFGYLYLTKQEDRINELYSYIIDEN